MKKLILIWNTTQVSLISTLIFLITFDLIIKTFFFVWILETEEGFTLVNAKSPINLSVDARIPDFDEISNLNPMSILRKLRRALGRDQFRQILYAVLIGIQILVRGPPLQSLESLYGLCSLVPRACQRVKTQAPEYMDSKMCNFISKHLFYNKINQERL